MNPFFKKFPIEPQLFHPNAQWCADSELFGCIHVPIDIGDDKFGNLLHPTLLRPKRDVSAWLKEDEFIKEDRMWQHTIPTADCSFFASADRTNLCKLSWSDADPYYLIDAASVRIARLIDVMHGSVFLDICSAPGGKSLVVLDKMLRKKGENCFDKLVCNEMGFKRFKQMQQVIASFVPQQVRTSHLVQTQVDGKLIGLAAPQKYDSILCDVPCSSDRHLLRDEVEMNKWTLRSCKNLAKTQYALLRSALEAVKIGGFVIYATCSLNEAENDEMIRQILKKKKEKVQSVPITAMNVGEETEFGWKILPDVSPFDEGPLFVARLRRIG